MLNFMLHMSLDFDLLYSVTPDRYSTLDPVVLYSVTCTGVHIVTSYECLHISSCGYVFFNFNF